jgi:hypothetical protein
MTSSHATQKHHHVPHVNAVDKAATLRAQSEVRTVPRYLTSFY